MESKITIREIFQDHWETFTKEYPDDMIRPVVHSEVQKVISCGDPSGGFAMYCCPHCGAYKIVPFRCHSRFCNTCGVAYQSQRAEVYLPNSLTVTIAISSSQLLKNFAGISKRIADFLMFSSSQLHKPSQIGSMNRIIPETSKPV